MMDQRICAAIESKHHLAFNYDGLPREVEPHAHGTSFTGKDVVRGFQTAGESWSGAFGWRLWDVAKMEGFRVLDSTFAEPRPDYVQGDSHMHPVHCEL